MQNRNVQAKCDNKTVNLEVERGHYTSIPYWRLGFVRGRPVTRRPTERGPIIGSSMEQATSHEVIWKFALSEQVPVRVS